MLHYFFYGFNISNIYSVRKIFNWLSSIRGEFVKDIMLNVAIAEYHLVLFFLFGSQNNSFLKLHIYLL